MRSIRAGFPRENTCARRPGPASGVVAAFFFACSWIAALAAPGNTEPAHIAPAWDRPWQIRAYDTAAGLSQQRVFDIDFETNGVVWLATSDGLRRYDGFVWERFGVGEGLPSALTRAVLVSKSGQLWVGTAAGVGVYDCVARKYTPCGAPLIGTNASIRSIIEEPGGDLWFCSDQWPDPTSAPAGLVSLHNGVWRAWREADGLASDYILNYFRDSSGRQFAMTLSGTVVRQDGAWRKMGERDPGALPHLLMMAEDGRGNLFFQREGDLWTLTGGEWKRVGNESQAITTDRDGTLTAVCRERSPTGLRIETWNGKALVPVSSAFGCPPNARIYCIRQAPDGAFWVAGQGVLVRWEKETGSWRCFPSLPTPKLSDGAGRMWFASESNVVFHADGRFNRVPALKDLCAVDSRGRAWGAPRSGVGLAAVPLDGGPIHFEDTGVAVAAFNLGDSNGPLWAVGEDASGRAAISRREGESWRALADPFLENKTTLNAVADGNGGFWWLAREAGSMEYDLAHITARGIERQTLLPARPPLMYPGFAIAAGYQWLGGFAALYRRPLSANQWEKAQPAPRIRLSDMLPLNSEILFIAGGAEGGLSGCALFANGQWKTEPGPFLNAFPGRDGTVILTSRGGLHLRRQRGTLDMDFVPLPADVFCSRVTEDAQNNLWVATADGVLRYTPDKDPPQTLLSTPVHGPPLGRELIVSMTGIKRYDITNRSASFKYSWRFDNHPWSLFQEWPGRTLPLGNLPVGQHELQARARDANGNVDATPAVIAFTIVLPPIQEQPWFKPLVGGIALLVAYLVWLGIKHARLIAQANEALRREVAVRGQAEGKLQQARDELERRVLDRTAELSKANESLSLEIAERRRAEELRSKLEEQLRHAQKMEAVGALAGGIAHEFNNILATIVPYTHLAIEDAPNAETRENLNHVLIAAERARLLVQQILVFSGRQRRERKLIDLASPVQEAIKFLHASLSPGVEIRSAVHPGPLRAVADLSQIYQVIVNLGDNAAKAFEGGVGVLTIALEPVEADEALASRVAGLFPGLWARLTVADDGPGMSEEIRRRVFDPFFTTGSLASRTGLGLPVVHGIVAEHGGVITLESAPGKGARFDIYLPTRADAGDPPTPARLPSATEPAPVPPPGPSAPGGSPRVLLVDDEPSLASVLSQMLEHYGFATTPFTDPAAALERFRARPDDFDVVLTDMSMPGFTGIELAEQMRKVRDDIPILLSTGLGHAANPAVLRRAGIVEVLLKPIEPAALRQAVLRAVNPKT